MKKLLAVALFATLIASNAHSTEVLWYSLENGSKLEMKNDIGVDLTGRIGIEGCEKGRQIKAKLNKYVFYAFKYDNVPEALMPHLLKSYDNTIPVFGGARVSIGGWPIMEAYRDGRVFTFTWFLQQQLENDLGSEAVVFTRKLNLDEKQKNAVSFLDNQQVCPETISLNLDVIDTRTTYVPKSITADGNQITFSDPKEIKDEVVGHVTIVAAAIPNSLEKLDEGDTKRLELLRKAEKRMQERNADPVNLNSQPQVNDPNHPVSVQELQGSPKPQPRFKRLKNSEQSQ